MGYTQIPLAEQPSKTKEYELLSKEIELQNKLRILEEKLIQRKSVFRGYFKFSRLGY